MKIIILYTLPNLISLIGITILYKKLKPKWLQLFIYFLLLNYIQDLSAYFYSAYFKKSNHFITNIYLPISFGFYFLLFYITAETTKSKRLIAACYWIYVLFSLADVCFVNGFYYFNTYAFALGSILILLCCLLYFVRLFTSDSVMNYFRIPMFWIATGLLFFFTGSLVQHSFIRYFIENKIDPDGSIYYFIMVTLNIILHSTFIISFLCNQSWEKAR